MAVKRRPALRTLTNEGVMETTQTHVKRALDFKIINIFFFQKSLLCKHDASCSGGTMVLPSHLLEHCIMIFFFIFLHTLVS